MTTNQTHPITNDTLLIGDRLVPKRGRTGKAGHVKTLSDTFKDYVVQPLTVVNAYRGDKDFCVRLDDGMKVTLPLSVIKADWNRA